MKELEEEMKKLLMGLSQISDSLCCWMNFQKNSDLPNFVSTESIIEILTCCRPWRNPSRIATTEVCFFSLARSIGVLLAYIKEISKLF